MEHSKSSSIISSALNQNEIDKEKYIETLLHALVTLNKDVLSTSDTFMSITEYRNVKIAIESIVSVGIVPCLLPGIGAGLSKSSYHNAPHFSEEKLSDYEKYNRLSSITRILIDLYNEISLRPAIHTQLGVILGALLQLAHAPLLKPTNNDNNSTTDFQMTQELYEKLSNDQKEFSGHLKHFIQSSPQSSIIRELMVLSGLKDAPNWLRRKTRSYLIDTIVEPSGVMSLIVAICEDTLDVGLHWNHLDTISRLVAFSHGNSPEQYYNAICPQLINILKNKTSKNSTVIANHCIAAIYEVQPQICIEKIVNVIAKPLMVSSTLESNEQIILSSENCITECIEDLTKCFVSHDAKFKNPPCILMKTIAIPLFYMYKKLHQSASLLRTKVQQLLIQLLNDEKLRDNLFSIFLEHNDHHEYFGEKLSFQFGANGNLEVINTTVEVDSDLNHTNELADSLFHLIKQDQSLCVFLLNYLLKWLTNFHESTPQRLETMEDFGDTLYKQMAAMTLLSNLMDMSTVRKGLIKSPQLLISMIQSLFVKDNTQDIDNLYTSLMLIKVILSEEETPNDWTAFNNFAKFLKEKSNLYKSSSSLINIVQEIIDIIKRKGQSRRYQDLSSDSKCENTFDKALRDLADPLLPVRAHGLMTLTKLIEKSDPEAIAKRHLILCFFQENLKDTDSFVYLTAINGLCAMALSFPREVIEILVEEFIEMPKRTINGPIDPENRVKLGEILVKTTRALGEMASLYKNILINGFLCAIRDSDSMVRASSLSCLGELCKVLGFRLGNAITEILYCLECIIETDSEQECRRAAVLVTTLLIRGLEKHVLMDLGSDLLPVYRRLKYLRDNDNDDVLRLHAQLALEELDDIVKNTLFAKPQIQKTIFLLS